MMKISLRRAMKISAVASAITFGGLWLWAVLLYHFNPLETLPGALWWAAWIFAGMLSALRLAYGPFTRGKE